MLPRLDTGGLVRVLWCYATAGELHEELWAAVYDRLGRLPGRALTATQSMQLFQADVAMQVGGGGEGGRQKLGKRLWGGKVGQGGGGGEKGERGKGGANGEGEKGRSERGEGKGREVGVRN